MATCPSNLVGFGDRMACVYPDVYLYSRLLPDLSGGNSNIFGIFIPKLGEMIQFDEHIFQMGWFNHQPEIEYWNNIKKKEQNMILIGLG